MRTIVFATANPNKVREVGASLGPGFRILSLPDIGCTEEIAETGLTLEENALIKARYVKQHFGYDCFSEDTGLEIQALDGAPGVYTARFAGPECTPEDNINLTLKKMQGMTTRAARFRTIIALISGGQETLFEGIINGRIATEPSGSGGFGYDPIFIPEGHFTTFAEMPLEAKKNISHRGRAVAKLMDFLKI
ncbi:MAG TPA: RdgB/HAM1 family non-canonical purine NTP pyrophosphatase [Flavilitoribacter sp.]|nr:RdgB/HAM1 family non-canonical purine NTP pyrophosphatase [Flavilitoribacter sp.]HMQ86411.1 RdgB/HAM1 family non-canonical purine NTP pyrophosphatase [Flavilitoribacter sp.]